MKTLLMGVLGLALVALVGAGVATTFGLQGRRTPAQAAGEPAELAAQVEALRAQVEALEGRLSELEVARPAVAPERAVAGPEGLDPELRSDLEEMVSAYRGGGEAGVVTPAFTQNVATALETIREREEAERDQEREERRIERIDERVDELVTELGLGTSQANDLREHMIAMDTKRDELRDAIRESGDWRSARDSFRELRDEADQELQEILTPDQYQKFKELDPGPGFGGGRFFGGGPGGGPGGGRRGGSGNDS